LESLSSAVKVLVVSQTKRPARLRTAQTMKPTKSDPIWAMPRTSNKTPAAPCDADEHSQYSNQPRLRQSSLEYRLHPISRNLALVPGCNLTMSQHSSMGPASHTLPLQPTHRVSPCPNS
jgi:hypothetical protein